jgi:hypothetical protein
MDAIAITITTTTATNAITTAATNAITCCWAGRGRTRVSEGANERKPPAVDVLRRGVQLPNLRPSSEIIQTSSMRQ